MDDMHADELSLRVLPAEAAVAERLALAAKALSDPIRIRMLQIMARGRGCCGLPPASDLAVPGDNEPVGICVCEFQDACCLGQSKVSYHLKVLKEAGLVREEVRGKWTFYSLNRETAVGLIDLLRTQLAL